MRTSNVERRTSNFEVKTGHLSLLRRSTFEVRRSTFALILCHLVGCATAPLYTDSFHDIHQWQPELETGGSVTAINGCLDIDVPAGASVWFKPMLNGPVRIEYKATAISAGGKNDRVSDLNCFWMASDSRNPTDFFAVPRTGKFADCNPLLCYYASIGGNSNTTTRFRRYIGSATTRPLRPQDDLTGKENLLTPNVEQRITLIADGSTVQFYRDGRKLFEMIDDHPYTSGRFAIRTVDSHLRIRDFRVYAVTH
jgi:hypothetical protein